MPFSVEPLGDLEVHTTDFHGAVFICLAGFFMQLPERLNDPSEDDGAPYQSVAELLPQSVSIDFLLVVCCVHIHCSHPERGDHQNTNYFRDSEAHACHLTFAATQGLLIIATSLTNDGPKTWTPASSPVFGNVAVLHGVTTFEDPLSVQAPAPPLVPITVTV